MAVELGPVTLEHLTDVQVRERARLARHAVLGGSGDTVQGLGRSSVEVWLCGSFYGADAQSALAALRQAYLGQQPLDLLAEAAGEGYVAKVVVAAIDVAQRVGYLDQFDYEVVLVEHVEPPPAPAPDPLSAIDVGLVDEAAGYVDDVQDTLAEVSRLAALVATPAFQDPTREVPQMLEDYEDAGGGRSDAVAGVEDLL